MHTQRNTIIQTVKTIVLAVILSIGISYAYAWVAPTALPPGGNVGAPINTEASAQKKIGGLTVGSLTTAGAVNATSTITETLRVAAGTPAAGKVLVSDAAGNASWATAPTSAEADTLESVVTRGAATDKTITVGSIRSNGFVRSTLNGFMFPDGTVQKTTARPTRSVGSMPSDVLPWEQVVDNTFAGGGTDGLNTSPIGYYTLRQDKSVLGIRIRRPGILTSRNYGVCVAQINTDFSAAVGNSVSPFSALASQTILNYTINWTEYDRYTAGDSMHSWLFGGVLYGVFLNGSCATTGGGGGSCTQSYNKPIGVDYIEPGGTLYFVQQQYGRPSRSSRCAIDVLYAY